MNQRSKLIVKMAQEQSKLLLEQEKNALRCDHTVEDFIAVQPISKIDFENLLFSPEVNELIENNKYDTDKDILNTENEQPIDLMIIEVNDSSNSFLRNDSQEENMILQEEPQEENIIPDNFAFLQVNSVADTQEIPQRIENNNAVDDTESDEESEEEWLPENNNNSTLESGSEHSDVGIENIEINDDRENYTGRPKKGRKRKYEGQTDQTRKLLKNSNKQHITKKGRPVSAKYFRDYSCSCSNHCHDKVSLEIRKNLFQKFWEAGNYERQNSILCSLVKENKIKRKRVPLSTIRNFTRTYLINDITVCRDIFINTLGISTKRVNTAIKKFRNLALEDKRGKHTNRKNISQVRYQEVISQISRIPTYISHYRRNETDKKFFTTDMTIEKMYGQYKNEVLDPVSISTYKHIFYTKFNITRKPLKKDTCNSCDHLTVKVANAKTESDKIKYTNLKTDHQKAAEDARQQLKTDIESARTHDHIETITFDLEKTLPLPRLPTGIVFYKRQLWLYNMGIHSGKSNNGHCFTWVEGLAGRGSQEAASCIMKYVSSYIGDNITELNMWSDSCGGQNRNIKLTLLMKRMLHKHPSLKIIRLRFLVSGHSFLPNDKDFGDIEKALKYHQRILTPEEYREIMRICRKKNPLVVHEMLKEDFFSVKPLEEMFVNRKIDLHGNKISWLQTREIVLKKESPYSLFFNKSFSVDELTEVNIQGKKRGKKNLDFSKELPLLWPEGKKISTEKLQNIKELMGLVEELNQDFYKNFISDENVVDDIDGYDGDLDFEIEND